MYGIEVPRAHADRAAALLRWDTLSSVLVNWPAPIQPAWTEVVVDLPYAAAIERFASDPRIAAALEEAHTAREAFALSFVSENASLKVHVGTGNSKPRKCRDTQFDGLDQREK